MYPIDQQVYTLQKITEASFVFLVGGVCYYGMEVIWRGYSHWSMAICGALGFWLLYRLHRRHLRVPLPLRALIGALLITAMELTVGSIVNLGMGWNLWDYSSLPFHFLGQICLPYSIVWFLLGFPCALVSYWIRRFVFLCDE